MAQQASADAQTRQATPNRNYPISARLRLRGSGSSLVGRGFLRFPKTFPPGAVILNATLRLYRAGAWTGTKTVLVRRITTSWTENHITWNNEPTTVATNVVTKTANAGADGSVIEIDVTELIQDAANGGAYTGLRITLSEDADVYVHSSEAVLSTLRPTLEVGWNQAPQAPDQLSPDDSALVSDSTPTLSWTNDMIVGDEQGASQVQISVDGGLTWGAYDSGKVANLDSQWSLDDEYELGVAPDDDPVSAVIPDTDQSGLGNPVEWVWSVHRVQWYNEAQGRWDGVLPVKVPPGGNASDWWIFTDLTGAADNHVLVSTPGSDRPDIVWDEDNARLYVLMGSPTTGKMYAFDYDAGADTYTVDAAVNGVAVGINEQASASATAMGRTPNGDLWVATNDANTTQLLVTKSEDGGATWATPVSLQTTVVGGKADISWFTNGGTTYVIVVGVENGSDPTNTKAYSFVIDQNEPVSGSWTNETANLPAFGTGAYGADDEISIARDDNHNIWMAHETENIDEAAGNPQLLLWKRTAAGVWSQTIITTFATSPSHKRPAVSIDNTNDEIYVFYGLEGQAGIGYRKAPLGSPGDLTAASDTPLFTGTFYNVHVPEEITPASGLLGIASAYGDTEVWYSYVPLTGGVASDDAWWRVRVWNQFDVASDWSHTAAFALLPLPDLTITAPSGGTVAELQPVFEWNLDGTQTRWRVILFEDDNGDWVETWRDQAADTAEFVGVPKGLITSAGAYKVRFEVWDDQTRDNGEHATEEVEFVYARSGLPAAVPSLTASLYEDNSPGVLLHWTRTTMPDAWCVVVDGVEEAVLDTAEDYEVSTNTFEYVYWGATPRQEHTFEVEAVVNTGGAALHGDGNDTATFTPRPIGIWLVDEDDSTAVLIAGTDEAGLDVGETGTTFQMVSSKVPVRITDAVRGYEGTISGVLLEQEDRDNFLELKRRAVGGHPLRLVVGDLAILVQLEAVSVRPTPQPGDSNYSVSFSVVQVARPWPTGSR